MVDPKKVAAVAAAGVIAGAAGLVGASLVSDNGGSSNNPRVTIFCGELKPLIEASSVYARWASQNKGERDKWLVYSSTICLDQLPVTPTMATSFGKALVAAGVMALTIDVPPTTTQPTTTPTSTTTTTTTQPPTTTTTTQPPTTTTTTTTPPPTAWTGPITITSGGTYAGSWESTNLNPAVYVQTSQPVTITGRVRNLSGGPLIKVQASGAQVTVDHVFAYGGSTYQTSARWFEAIAGWKSITLTNNTIENTRGIQLEDSTAGGSLLISRNKQHNVQGNATSPVGNFVQFRDVQNASIEVSWNEIINEYGNSYPEDIISIYKTANVNFHDNLLKWQSRPGNAGGSSQGGITIDCSTGSGCNSNTIQSNQLIGVEAILCYTTMGGNNNLILNNRIVNDGFLDDGSTRSNNGYVGMHVLSGGSNNHAHGNIVGYVNFNGARNDWALEGTPEGDTAEGLNNTHMPGLVTQATEQAEWVIWQTKLSANGITLGA